MSDLQALLSDLPALILDDFKTSSPQLLDLPNDLLPLILGHSQWSARRTCRALLDLQSVGCTSLKLRWGERGLGIQRAAGGAVLARKLCYHRGRGCLAAVVSSTQHRNVRMRQRHET